MARVMVTVVLAALLSSGCLGGSDLPDADLAPPEVVVQDWIRTGSDPTGDAMEWSESTVGAFGQMACRISMQTYGPCAGAVGMVAAAAPPGVVGVPAEPGLDLVGLEVQETSTSIHIAFVVQALDEGFTKTVPDEPILAPSARWNACWGEQGAQACATLWVLRQGGTLNAQPQFRREGTDCSTGGNACAWTVPMVIEAGSPARIILEVPRAALPDPETTVELAPWSVQSVRGLRGGEFVTSYLGTPAAAHWGTQPRRYYYVVDEMQDVQPLMLVLPAQRPASIDHGPHKDRPGDVAMAGRYGPDDADVMDIESFDLIETPTGVTIATHLRKVEAQNQEFLFDGVLRIANGPFLLYGIIDEGEGRVPYAYHCMDACEEYTRIPVQMAIEAGTPGWINLTFERVDVGSPPAGARVDLAWVRTLDLFQTVAVPQTPVPVSGEWWLGGRDDWSTPLPLRFLSLDTAS